MFKKLLKAPLFLLLFGFMTLFSLFDLITPERSYSENENKYLAAFPAVTLKTVINGDFATRYEEYIADQFLLRDGWITAKALTEQLLLKTENNGVVVGKNDYLFPKFYQFKDSYLRDNLSAIDQFAAASVSPVSVMVVPSSYYPLSDYLPAGLPVVEQGYFINGINDFLSANASAINVKDILSVNAQQYIYYRTDHHWTSYGAWLGYTQFAASAGFTPVEYSSLTPNRQDGFLGTSYNKSKSLGVVADTIEYFDFKADVVIDGQPVDGLYDLDKLDRRDKYAAFLHGNSGFTEITAEGSDRKKESILVIKDSFANCFVPFLTESYNKIYVVDPRHYNGSFSELAATRYTDVLILYGFENLVGDTNITKLGL